MGPGTAHRSPISGDVLIRLFVAWVGLPRRFLVIMLGRSITIHSEEP